LGRSNRPPGGQIIEGRSNRPVQCEQKFALCCIPVLHCCIGSGGVCFGSRGALCGVRALDWWFALFARAWFCLGCVKLLPLPKGSETCLLQVILRFAFSLAFDRLLRFLFSLVTKSCVSSMHSSRGRLRTMCGLRTGGWSLLGVMSD
jgi:hypothetical protein